MTDDTPTPRQPLWDAIHLDFVVFGIAVALPFVIGADPSPIWATSVVALSALAVGSWQLGARNPRRRPLLLGLLALPFGWATLNGVLLGLTPVMSIEPGAADGVWPWLVVGATLVNAIVVAILATTLARGSSERN